MAFMHIGGSWDLAETQILVQEVWAGPEIRGFTILLGGIDAAGPWTRL